jgi:hypothetical protein
MKTFDAGPKLRTIPKLMLVYYNLAIEAGLQNCSGRAAYMVNRHYNGDLRRLGLTFEEAPSARQLRRARIKALKSIRPRTAQTWLEHWENGGSLKALKYDQEQWNRYRRELRADLNSVAFP